MSPTNEQIIAEAERRWALAPSRPSRRGSVQDYIIEVMREGWTPPEPVVDPDILAFREWFADRNDPVDRAQILAGHWDSNFVAAHFVAGARMAREQNQKRIEELVEGLKSIAILGQNHLLATMAAQTLSKSGEPGWVATRNELR